MEPEPDAEALRRRLYRPEASAADLASYLHAAEAERPTEPPEGVSAEADRPSRRPFLIGAACVAGAALIGGLLLGGTVAAPAAATVTPTPSATDIGTLQPDVSWSVTFVPSSVLDGGSRAGAQGAAVPEGPDRYRYSIAQGDTVSGIAARFALCRADVIQSLPYGFSEGALPAGGMLELGRVSGLC